jgi:ribosomal protein L39E
MSRYIHKAKKLRLAKAGKQTKWAPVWIIPKINKGLKKEHPAKYTRVKRSWRKTKLNK